MCVTTSLPPPLFIHAIYFITTLNIPTLELPILIRLVSHTHNNKRTSIDISINHRRFSTHYRRHAGFTRVTADAERESKSQRERERESRDFQNFQHILDPHTYSSHTYTFHPRRTHKDNQILCIHRQNVKT